MSEIMFGINLCTWIYYRLYLYVACLSSSCVANQPTDARSFVTSRLCLLACVLACLLAYLLACLLARLLACELAHR